MTRWEASACRGESPSRVATARLHARISHSPRCRKRASPRPPAPLRVPSTPCKQGRGKMISRQVACEPVGGATRLAGARPHSARPCPRCTARTAVHPQMHRQRLQPTCLSASLALDGGLDAGLGAASALSQVVSALGFAAAAYYIVRELLPQQEQSEQGPPCSTCGGTGLVDCFCTRWSDKDVGCGTCRGGGKMTCSSCRGGGTAVPIPASLLLRQEPYR